MTFLNAPPQSSSNLTGRGHLTVRDKTKAHVHHGYGMVALKLIHKGVSHVPYAYTQDDFYISMIVLHYNNHND